MVSKKKAKAKKAFCTCKNPNWVQEKIGKETRSSILVGVKTVILMKEFCMNCDYEKEYSI